jgi:lipid II:glycine glycyltransferase (peptidoglycan interpeptide bridge formation enzyme)
MILLYIILQKIYNFQKIGKKNLKRSEKNKNLISLWSNPDAKIINHLYKKLEDYKKIKTQFTLKQINSLIKSFRKNLIVVVCENNEGKIISLRAAIIFNKKALDIFSISTFEGRKTYAGYGILWKLLELCKKRGVEIYDLGGVDKKNNSSVYNFKKGIGSIEYKYLGEFDWSNINFIRIIFGMIIKKMYN